MNGFVHFLHIEAKSLYTKILTLALDIYMSISKTNKTFTEIVYENGIFNELIESGETEGVYNWYGQNINMFRAKFRGILFDFNRELVWSFESKFLIIIIFVDRKNMDKFVFETHTYFWDACHKQETTIFRY